MTRRPVDELMRPREVDRWDDEYAAHVAAVENRYHGPGAGYFRTGVAWNSKTGVWVYPHNTGSARIEHTKSVGGPFRSRLTARPRNLRPEDDLCVLDLEFDED